MIGRANATVPSHAVGAADRRDISFSVDRADRAVALVAMGNAVTGPAGDRGKARDGRDVVMGLSA
jgi:hypothetical protein